MAYTGAECRMWMLCIHMAAYLNTLHKLYIHTYTSTRMRTHTHVYNETNILLCSHQCACALTPTHLHTHTNTLAHSHLHTCTLTPIHLHTHTYTLAHSHLYTCTLTPTHLHTHTNTLAHSPHTHKYLYTVNLTQDNDFKNSHGSMLLTQKCLLFHSCCAI